MKKFLAFLLLLIPVTFGSFSLSSLESKEPQIAYASNTEVEEFLSYWRYSFKPAGTQTCDITKAKFDEMYEKFKVLSDSDKAVIKNTKDDEEYTIGNVIETLVNKFYTPVKPQEHKESLDQSTTIIIIVVAAVFGMTTISIFFVLKNNKVIQ